MVAIPFSRLCAHITQVLSIAISDWLRTFEFSLATIIFRIKLSERMFSETVTFDGKIVGS